MQKGAVLLGGGCLLLGAAIGWWCAPRAPRGAPGEASDEIVLREPAPGPELHEAADRAPEPPLDPGELLELGRIEDEILAAFEADWRRWQEDPEDPELSERKRLGEEGYRAFLARSDQAVEQYFTPERIAAVPWTDLLAEDRAASWIGCKVEGFEHHIEDGVLHMLGPAPHVGGEGIISIGDREQWRDLVLDVEFMLVKGECSLFLRLPRTFQENVQNINLTTDDAYYEAGVSHEFTVSLIGSTQLEEDVGVDSMGPSKVKVPWTQVRKGALGISLPKNSEVRFTRLRAKILR
jgi:hypothetical protein